MRALHADHLLFLDVEHTVSGLSKLIKFLLLRIPNEQPIIQSHAIQKKQRLLNPLWQ